VIAREGINPPDVVVGPLTQDLLGDRADLMNVSEEVDDVLGTGEQRQVSKDDYAIETVVYESNEAAEQLRKGVHRSPRSFLSWQKDDRAGDRDFQARGALPGPAPEPAPGL